MTNEQLFALLKKHPIGFGCGLLAVICAVVLYLRGDLIAENQTEADKQAASAARALTNIKNATNLPEQLAEAQAMTKELEDRLMRAGQLASNLQYFYKLEAENEVKLLDVRQGSVASGKGAGQKNYSGVPYTVSIQGGYKQVMQFIQRLEAGRHFCRFINASFSKQTGTAYAQGMAVTLNIEILGTP